MTDLERYIKSAAKAARKARRTDGDKGTLTAYHQGLLAHGRARLAPDAGENVIQHSGYLAGHLTRWMIERGRRLSEELNQTIGYYSSAVADPHGQGAFVKPHGVLGVHGYAALLVEKKRGVALTEENERMLVEWLLSQAGKRPGPGLEEVIARRRRMRHERIGL